jgi:hypothetical protein
MELPLPLIPPLHLCIVSAPDGAVQSLRSLAAKDLSAFLATLASYRRHGRILNSDP